MTQKSNNHSFQIMMATCLVLILSIFPVEMAYADKVAMTTYRDSYMDYTEKYSRWIFSIEEELNIERSYRVFSPTAEELVNDCNIHLIESDRVSITVQQTLFDSIGGYINLLFTSDQYILRPITCLDIYSPYYQAAESYSLPVCFIEIEIGDYMGYYSLEGGLSEDQKQYNLIALCKHYSDADLSRRENNVHLKVILHFFNLSQESIETMEFYFPIEILENIDECHLSEPMIHEEYNLIVPRVDMVITPIRMSIKPVGRRALDSKAECKYYWTLADQDNHLIFDYLNSENGIYYSSIPEPIYYVVYEFDENGTEMIVYRKQLIHKENAWVIQ